MKNVNLTGNDIASCLSVTEKVLKTLFPCTFFIFCSFAAFAVNGSLTLENVTPGQLQTKINEAFANPGGPQTLDEVTGLTASGMINDNDDIAFIAGFLPKLQNLDLSETYIIGTIANERFNENRTLKTVILSHLSGYNVSKRMFLNCTSLESVDVSSAISFDEYAFYGSGIKNVLLPSSYTVPAGMFSFCKSLESIDVSKATEFGMGAFTGASALKSITLPDSYYIPELMFSECRALKSIDVSNATGFGASAFWKSGLEKITLPASSYEISREMFYDCPNLRSIDLSGATKIGAYAFGFSDNLKTLLMPDTPPQAAVNAFGFAPSGLTFLVGDAGKYSVLDSNYPSDIQIVEYGLSPNGKIMLVEGETLNLAVSLTPAAGTAVYCWNKDGQPLANATQSAYNKIVELSDNGVYTVDVWGLRLPVRVEVEVNAKPEETGVKPLSPEGFRLYPNPVLQNQSVFLELNTGDKPLPGAHVEVYTLTGQLVKQLNVNNRLTEINLSLPAGIYIFNVEDKKMKVVVTSHK